jgi:hypothetical protein
MPNFTLRTHVAGGDAHEQLNTIQLQEPLKDMIWFGDRLVLAYRSCCVCVHAWDGRKQTAHPFVRYDVRQIYAHPPCMSSFRSPRLGLFLATHTSCVRDALKNAPTNTWELGIYRSE